jgi:alpha-beta hydrolase superfamily lysophospholipase
MPPKTDGYFKTHDHHRLFYQKIVPEKKSRAVLVCVHGVNEHSGRYGHFIEAFSQDFTLYLFDHRGHGRSDGVRSHVEKFDEYVNDVAAFVDWVTCENPSAKLFLIGHSLGGQITVNYLARFSKSGLSGFILSSPNLRLKMKLNPLKKMLADKLSQWAPQFKLPNDISPDWISRDPLVVKDFKKDPLVGKAVSVRLAQEILTNLETVLDLAPKIKIPGLLMHAGDDKITDQQGTVDFFERMIVKDKTLKIYPGFYHELFNDLGKEDVFEDVRAWLEKRV